MSIRPISLVTGGAGFIGSHLVEELALLGHKVVVVDSLISSTGQNISFLVERYPSQVVFIHADVSLPVSEYLPKEITPDFVFHFASPASPPLYQLHPVKTYLTNSIGTHHLLSYLKTHNPAARLLFASTSEIYGDPLQHPQQEDYWGNVNPNGPRSCYDESKRMGETICGVFSRDFGVDVRIVRIFNTYGPRINPNDGRVIPEFIQSILNEKPVKVHGDGTQTRSFCYVDDLVKGILLMMFNSSLNGETLNLGNPNELSILAVAQEIGAIVGKPIKTEFLPLPQDDPVKRKPDIAKAIKLLGWEPQVDLKQGLSKTIEWFKNL